MKVLYLLGSLNRGGAETLILDIFKNAKYYRINFFCTFRFPNGVFQKEFFESGASMQYIPYKAKGIISYLLKLRSYIKLNKFDIIHAHQPIDAFYAIIACIGLKIPILLTLHSYDFETRGIASIALKVALKFTKLNLYVSETQKEYYIQKYKLNYKKQSVLYNGISFSKFSEKQIDINSSSDIKTELSIPQDKLLLSFVGNFTDVRDQLTVCKFISLLKNKFANFHFVFIGSKVARYPEFYDKCVDYCSINDLNSYVTFLGNREDVPSILSQSDAFIYYTNYDTFGIAVVEAMSAGIPVFVNDWEVMREITVDGEYATLYKSDDINDLLEKFLYFLNNKLIYNQKAKQASEYVRSKFSIENYMSELQNLYEGIEKNKIVCISTKNNHNK